MKSYTMRPLSEQEQAAHDGYTHLATIGVAELTDTVAGEAQTLDIGNCPVGGQVKISAHLPTPFDSADAAYDTMALTIGDGTTPNSYLASMELNVRGTEVIDKTGSLVGPTTSTVVTPIRCTFTPKAAKKLSDLTTGLLYLFVKLVDPHQLDALKGASSTR